MWRNTIRTAGSRPRATQPDRTSKPVRAASARGLVRALAGDRGSVSAELVIATPLLLLMLLLIVQFAMWSHATHIAQAAASQGLAATRVQNGTTTAGHTQAEQLLKQLAGGPLTHGQVAVQRSATTASVAISGQAASVVPFLHLPVHAEASGPVEAWSNPTTPGG